MSPARRRTLIVCPGRGSYGRGSLGSLAGRGPRARSVIAACDAHRRALGRTTVTALDAESTFRGARHVAGEHASLLTFACSMADAFDLDDDRFDVVGVTGNSMGWYTALALAGALPLVDAIELVEAMGARQAGGPVGGQLMLPLTDDDGCPDPARRDRIDEALARVNAQQERAWWSIDLFSHAVLGATDAGLSALREALPEEVRGGRRFPLRLPLHSAFHTPLLADTSAWAGEALAHLRFRAPDRDLVDGRGVVHRPLVADPHALAAYTLGHQVVRPFDFATAVRTALRHTGAEVVVVLGPGNSLGGPLSRLLVDEGWRGLRTRDAFDAAQADEPVLLAFGHPNQRARWLS